MTEDDALDGGKGGNGVVNPGFEDDLATNTVLDMNDLNDKKRTDGEDVRKSSPIRGAAEGEVVIKGVGEEEGEKEEGEEDYSFFTYLPCYGELQKRVAEATDGVDVGAWLRRLVYGVLATAYLAYFGAVLATHTGREDDKWVCDGNGGVYKSTYWCHGDGLLVIFTLLVFIGLLYFQVIKPYLGETLYKRVLAPGKVIGGRAWSRRVVRVGVCVGMLVGVLLWLVVDAWSEPRRLVSLLGVVVLLTLGFVFSTAPRKVRWRHVAWGMGLQFVLGVVILRWPAGKLVFQCAGDKVAAFLKFTDEGSGFIFGDLVKKNFFFAFEVLPVILFFSFCVQILYYYGVMQWIVMKLGWLLQVSVGTTACESVNAAANIFLGMTEAPLLIKPYLSVMTKSELHAVMTGGFATIAGSVLAAYISFGVDPAHLLSASVMSAPAALAFAKLFYPETKKTRTGVKDIRVQKAEETNALHAAMVGVSNAIPLVANIAANLIAFYAFIKFVNSVFNWTCTLAGAEDGVCSLETAFGRLLMPLAWVMGVDWAECDLVGELIGLKTIVNEFVAYERLAEMKNESLLSRRAEIISTYALCGFSNISSIGVILGSFSAMCPERRADMASVVVRAMIAGSAACFLTACIAGTLLSDGPVQVAEVVNATIICNATTTM